MSRERVRPFFSFSFTHFLGAVNPSERGFRLVIYASKKQSIRFFFNPKKYAYILFQISAYCEKDFRKFIFLFPYNFSYPNAVDENKIKCKKKACRPFTKPAC